MTKPLTTSHLLLALALAMLLSCSNLEFDNSLDPKAKSYVGSSSSEETLSSSDANNHSSSSNAHNDNSSSSGEQGSSSSEGGLSSSGEQGSSSSAEFSSSSSEMSSSSSLKKCTVGFNDSEKFCHDGLIHNKCDGKEYNPTAEICTNKGITIPAECNGDRYNPLERKCDGNTLLYRCGIDDPYFYDQNDYKWYDPATHFCTRSESEPKVVELCGGKGYDTRNKMCHYDKAKDFFIDIRDGEVYPYVKIGEQTWMAKNLNHNIENSKCGDGEILNNENTTTCETYGRLYDWATAMNLEASCNSSTFTCYNGQVNEKHRGICPIGWHIPSNAEWDALYRFADGTLNESPDIFFYNSSTAGRYLKVTNGWDDNVGESGNGEDKFGFSALPGGYGYSGGVGNFYGVGKYGYWWSPHVNGSGHLFFRIMDYDREDARWNYAANSDRMYNIRCVKD